MSDDFDSNGYGGFDSDGDGRVDIAEQDLDDNDISYNKSHPYYGRKKSKWFEDDKNIIADIMNMSKAGKVQLLFYTILYFVIFILHIVFTGDDEIYIYFVLAIIPYAIICFLISLFIFQPIIDKINKQKDKDDTKVDTNENSNK